MGCSLWLPLALYNSERLLYLTRCHSLPRPSYMFTQRVSYFRRGRLSLLVPVWQRERIGSEDQDRVPDPDAGRRQRQRRHPRPRRDQHPLGLGRRDPSKIREKNLHSAAGGTRQSSGNRWFLSTDIYGTTCLPPGLCSLLLIIDSVFQSYYLRWFKSAQEWLTKLSFIIQLPTVSVIIFA